MILEGICRKCKGKVRFDVGEMSREEAEGKLKTFDSFHCDAGNHTEMKGPLEMYDFDWDNLKEGVAMPEEQFEKNLKEQFKTVMKTDELKERFNIESFMMGMCLTAKKEDPDALVAFMFTHSPKGERYYYTNEVG